MYACILYAYTGCAESCETDTYTQELVRSRTHACTSRTHACTSHMHARHASHTTLGTFSATFCSCACLEYYMYITILENSLRRVAVCIIQRHEYMYACVYFYIIQACRYYTRHLFCSYKDTNICMHVYMYTLYMYVGIAHILGTFSTNTKTRIYVCMCTCIYYTCVRIFYVCSAPSLL